MNLTTYDDLFTKILPLTYSLSMLVNLDTLEGDALIVVLLTLGDALIVVSLTLSIYDLS
jgi:hypothetical protein